MGCKTIPFNKTDIKGYLDRCIIYWKTKQDFGDNDAKCYIDAFQCVKKTLFGDKLK